MKEFQKIKLNGTEYYIIDSIQNFRAEDSFIDPKNKLAQYTGHGEKRKHVGTYIGDGGKKISDFFEYNNWGIYHKDEIKNKKTYESAKKVKAIISEKQCFFSKSNFIKYLNDTKIEYMKQEQLYHNNIGNFYQNRYKKVSNLNDEIIPFSIYDVSDNKDAKQNRGYIRSDDEIWSLWRELILPSISYLSILKLIPLKGKKNKPFFYFRILLDYQFRSFQHAKFFNEEEKSFMTENISTSSQGRQGAKDYRKKVLEHMPQCPFTQITDERLLIASHIKPYAACMNDNEIVQAIDYLNGLSLSPTYDKLFDQGYITFTDNGELICGTQLSVLTWEKLKINPNAKNKMRIYPENREYYLNYHRKYIFQDNFSDLI